jgi:hypothetical protein
VSTSGDDAPLSAVLFHAVHMQKDGRPRSFERKRCDDVYRIDDENLITLVDFGTKIPRD